MLNNYHGIKPAAEAASELLLDLGDFVTGGKRPPRSLTLAGWCVTLGGAAALWRWLPWLFDHYPGTAVIAAGLWAMGCIGTVGLSMARVKYS